MLNSKGYLIRPTCILLRHAHEYNDPDGLCKRTVEKRLPAPTRVMCARKRRNASATLREIHVWFLLNKNESLAIPSLEKDRPSVQSFIPKQLHGITAYFRYAVHQGNVDLSTYPIQVLFMLNIIQKLSFHAPNNM